VLLKNNIDEIPKNTMKEIDDFFQSKEIRLSTHKNTKAKNSGTYGVIC
jgi:hypothetical protein